jgi:homoserine O-acetyltransferase/O-succinyltransferase
MQSTNENIQPKIFRHAGPFTLESGITIPGLHLAYTTLGEMNSDCSNVVWIFHALTANSNPVEWWPGLVGAGKLFDPARYFIICVNMPGSCYGSTGPLELNPETAEPYYHEFPFFTPRDMARAFGFLKTALNISKIHIGIGGSMGGQQLLEWAVEEPGVFEHIIPIATNAFHSPWGKAFNATQRMCIETDPGWKENRADAGINGMKVARSMALISYRHYRTYAATQQDDPEKLEGFRSESYQRYQGEKLAARFNAFSYYALTKGMDAHNLGRSRGTVHEALARITAKTLVIGIETDVLYPVEEQAYIARQVKGAELAILDSAYGHDGFLLEFEKIEKIIKSFLLNRKVTKYT